MIVQKEHQAGRGAAQDLMHYILARAYIFSALHIFDSFLFLKYLHQKYLQKFYKNRNLQFALRPRLAERGEVPLLPHINCGTSSTSYLKGYLFYLKFNCPPARTEIDTCQAKSHIVPSFVFLIFAMLYESNFSHFFSQ